LNFEPFIFLGFLYYYFFYNYYFSLYLCFSLHENITIKNYNKKNQYTWNLNTQITKVLIWSWKLTFSWENTSKCWKIPVGPRGAHVYSRRPTINCWIWNASASHSPLKQNLQIFLKSCNIKKKNKKVPTNLYK